MNKTKLALFLTLAALAIATLIQIPTPARTLTRAVPEVVVYVKGASVNAIGATIITYDATRNGGGSVSNQQLMITQPSLGDVAGINQRIIDDAKLQTGANDSDRTTVYGGAVAQFAQGPQ